MNIFCDLDGVLIDSRNECLEIIKNIFPEVLKSKIYNKNFYLNRGLVDPPEDFLILHELISKLDNKKKISTRSFNFLKKSISQRKLNIFKKNFFKTRRNLMNKNYDKWLKLNKITPFATKLNNFKNLNVIIITTKNFEASKSICKNLKINFNQIIANEHIKKKSKGELINIYLDKHNINKAIFIDDSNKHLKTCKDKRVIRLFANWGYNKTSIYKQFKLTYFKKLIN